MSNAIGGLFYQETSAEVVNARMGATADERLATVMNAVVWHLHALVKEVEPTHEEWMAAIQFLTETGQMCSEWRQEFILLSDVLGVSMLVDSINHQRPIGTTPNTILGPFYVAGAPEYRNGANICLDGKGEPSLIKGRILDAEGKPTAGARLDVWQTNDDGFYDVQQPGIQPPFNLRGVFTSEANGEYWFRTAKPRFYPIPDDGPVGKLLGALGRHPNRAAHLHFIITAPGFDRTITHIFPDDCQYLHEDAVFGVKEALITHFAEVDDPAEAIQHGLPNPFHRVDWDFVLERAR